MGAFLLPLWSFLWQGDGNSGTSLLRFSRVEHVIHFVNNTLSTMSPTSFPSEKLKETLIMWQIGLENARFSGSLDRPGFVKQRGARRPVKRGKINLQLTIIKIHTKDTSLNLGIAGFRCSRYLGIISANRMVRVWSTRSACYTYQLGWIFWQAVAARSQGRHLLGSSKDGILKSGVIERKPESSGLALLGQTQEGNFHKQLFDTVKTQ